MKFLSRRAVWRLRNHPTAYRLARRARFVAGALVPPRKVAGVPGRVHANDFMLSTAASAGDYVEGAAEVLRLVDRVLSQVGRDRSGVGRWLDFGCGYGRVLRFLVQDVSPDHVWVTDVVPEAVAFCSREFHTEPIRDLALRPDLAGSFDVVYALSVLTHLPKDQVESTADLLVWALAPGGVLIFTTHSDWSVEQPERYGREFLDKRSEIEAGLAATGCHFIPYAHSKDGSYGITWHTPVYIHSLFERLPYGVERIPFDANGLNLFGQVAYAYRRSG